MPPPRRPRLDLSALRLASALSNLIDPDLPKPDPDALRLAPGLDLWSVSESGFLIGRDAKWHVVAIKCWNIATDLTWAEIPDGPVRLLRRSKLPIQLESA